jgi:hypothetical protein
MDSPTTGRVLSTDRGMSSDALWYKDAIIYEVHACAFCDSNEDGRGDFPGLASKLDYLQDLGITVLWLLPFFPSPWRDDGYDISDYKDARADRREYAGPNCASGRTNGSIGDLVDGYA